MRFDQLTPRKHLVYPKCIQVYPEIWIHLSDSMCNLRTRQPPVKSTASRKKVSVFGDQILELMTRFVFLNPLQLLGCSLYKKYQPIHFIKNLIHLNFLEISGNSLLKFLQHIRRVEVIK